MKITQVDTFLVPPQWLFVRVRTDEGTTGWGEGGIQFRSRSVAAAVDELADYLVGENPLAIERHWQVLTKVGFYRGGPILSAAVAAVDEALWDIKGKVHGVAVYELLGGPVRDRTRAYIWVGGDDVVAPPRERLVEEALRRRDEGFTACKVSPPRTAPIDTAAATAALVDRVAAIRDACGTEFDVAIDLHGRYSPAMSKRLLPLLEPYHPLFVEEPVQPEYTHLLPELAGASSVPLATGERLFSRWDFRDVVRSGVAVVQPDVSQAGGISETRRIASLAEVYGVSVAPHCPLGPIALASCLQIDFATPNAIVQEQSISYFGDEFLRYVSNPSVFEIRNGYFARPTGPGLGVEIDEAAVEEGAATGHRERPPLWLHPDGSYAEF